VDNNLFNIALEAAVELWRLLLTGRFSLLDQWIQFLEVSTRFWTCKIDLNFFFVEKTW
jgi:hypothetical protein